MSQPETLTSWLNDRDYTTEDYEATNLPYAVETAIEQAIADGTITREERQ